jgi:hypothetical protein
MIEAMSYLHPSYIFLSPWEPASIARLIHRPRGSLLGAEAAISVDLLARSVEIDLDVEAVFSASESVALRRRNLNFVHAGAHAVIARVTGDGIAFADVDFGFALALSVETDARFPGADALAFGHWVGRHVEILDLNALATAAIAVRRHRFRREIRHPINQKPG